MHHWTDELAMVRINAAMMPEVGVPAHAADAFAKMVAGEGKGHVTRADMNLVCDLVAWWRGHTEGNETSAIVGGWAHPGEGDQRTEQRRLLQGDHP